MLYARPLESITFDHIQTLITSSYAEDQHLDYKEELPDLAGAAKPDAARKKLLADVAAFANAGGGDILFGVQEGRTDGVANGIPTTILGIDTPNVDAIHRQWVAIIDSGLDPKMAPKVRFHSVTIPGKPLAVLILRVPRSYAAPHMVTETGRFHVRHGPQNRTLDTAEIRSAFALSEAWATQVRRFRDERISRIVGDDTPVKLMDEARLVVHVVPLSATRRGFAIDLSALRARTPQPIYSGFTGYDLGFNVDGLVVCSSRGKDGTVGTYSQFFRDGSIELAITTVSNEKYVFPNRIEPHVVKVAKSYLPQLVEAGAEYPFAISVALLGMKGLLPRPDQWDQQNGIPLPRDVVLLPDVVIEGPDANVHGALRPTFDALAQALGSERSDGYGPNGEWLRKET